jgi:nucleoid DNA-binding protein
MLVKEIIQRLFDGIIETLEKEGHIELRNFGVFKVRKRKLRQGRNPRTGESVMVPAKLVVTFKPGREMEERVGQVQKVSNEDQ